MNSKTQDQTKPSMAGIISEKGLAEHLISIGLPEPVVKSYGPAIAVAVGAELQKKLTPVKLKKLAAKAVAEAMKA